MATGDDEVPRSANFDKEAGRLAEEIETDRWEALMNKTIEAWLRGYVFFRVNGRGFYRYNSANAYAEILQTEDDSIRVSVSFTGFHVFKGWRTFLLVYVAPTPTMTINARM